jgi:hypothetical protein
VKSNLFARNLLRRGDHGGGRRTRGLRLQRLGVGRGRSGASFHRGGGRRRWLNLGGTGAKRKSHSEEENDARPADHW